ncbi:pitrilysin family protein [Aurantimonas sp. Leaf443]|uniref:M16 family metallopeptidase n=1 Tax=Aurantimonas sp. Leaf443 TaxID=1736378 RepID=UPI0006FF8043|nr:pitrilysin family protein [Aurantimonas sp. Leaf443]KQT88518.1 zinc protease [Aurantimonas sp. Leaf443]
MPSPRRAGPAAAIALCLCGPALAQDASTQPPAPPPAEARTLPDAPKPAPGATQKIGAVTTFTLGNGLQVVVLPDRRAPVVTQMVYYKVGSADETPGKSGNAHFLEHLMFKGTKTHPAGEFSARVAEIGGQENAFTTSDYTGYYQQVPADALKMVMEFESDRMANLVLSDEAVLPERDVILEERRMRVDSDPGSKLSEAVQSALFQNSPYGLPVIGWRPEIEALSRADAIAFYDKYYTPNNAILLVAGDVDEATVRTLAEETYGKLERRAEPGPRKRPAEPEPVAERDVKLSDPRVTQPSLQTLYLVPSDTTARDGEAEALDILSDILGSGTTSRLYRALVVDKGIAAATGAYYAGTALDDGQFVTYGTPRGEADLEAIEAGIAEEVAKLQRDGITEAELERAKNRVRKNVIYLKDSQTAMARRLGAALATGRTIEDVETWPQRIEAVTVDQVNAVARKYLKPERSVSGYLLPADRTAAEAAPAPAPAAAPAAPRT